MKKNSTGLVYQAGSVCDEHALLRIQVILLAALVFCLVAVLYIECGGVSQGCRPVAGIKASTVAFVEVDESQIDCMAKNVFFEARGDGRKSMMLVALTTVNRAVRRGKSPCEVVHAKSQFSWTNQVGLQIKDNPIERNAWSASRAVAQMVYLADKSGNLPKIDFTNGATHYHKVGLHPYWADAFEFGGRAGSHLYYRSSTGV